MSQQFCPHCHEPLDPGAKFCVVCGQPVAQPEPRQSQTVRPRTEGQSNLRREEGGQTNLRRGQIPAPSPDPRPRQEPQPRLCPNPACRQPLEPGKRFCSYCGAAADGSAPIPAPPAPPAPKSRLWLWIGLGAGAVAVLALALVFLLGGMGGSSETAVESRPADTWLQQSTQETQRETVPVITQAPGISAQEAGALVTSQFGCEANLVVENPEGYTFQCVRGSHTLGTVVVDRDGNLTVESGMETSRVYSLSLDTINGYFPRGTSYSYAVVDLNTGEMVGTSMNTEMSSSVIIDIPILYALAKEMESGSVTMETQVPVVSGKSARSSLSAYAGKSLSVEFLLEKMFSESSGDAACSLMNYLGMDHINQICHDAGYPNCWVRNYIGTSGIDYTSRDNVVSAADVCGMLDELYNGTNPYINASFLENNMRMDKGVSYSNDGLGRNVPFSNLKLYFNGIKNDKYNEVILVNDGNGHRYAVCYLACYTASANLMTAAKQVGGYVDGVMCQ